MTSLASAAVRVATTRTMSFTATVCPFDGLPLQWKNIRQNGYESVRTIAARQINRAFSQAHCMGGIRIRQRIYHMRNSCLDGDDLENHLHVSVDRPDRIYALL